MSPRKLDNYLKTYRKRAGLSQHEISYLLGTIDGCKASRHERAERIPTLATALTYEAILRVAVRELFAGVYEKAERDAIRRAHVLRKRLAAEGRHQSVAYAYLLEIAPVREKSNARK